MQPWNIRVVAPPPQNLAVQASGSQVQLSWDRYTCPNASTIRIYRRASSFSFTRDACNAGVPANSGYVLVGEVAADATSFRVFASPGGGESIASAEACAPGRIPNTNDLGLKKELENIIQVYPNPAKDRILVVLRKRVGWNRLRLYNVTGQLLQEVQGNGENSIQLELPQLAPGLHLLQVETDQGLETTRVLIE